MQISLQTIVDDIKLDLTGDLLHLEIPDDTIKKTVLQSLRVLNRFIDETRLVTVPYADCIDTKGFKCTNIVHLYRVDGILKRSADGLNSGVDPMYAQMWLTFGTGGLMYNLQDYLMNYMSYNTMLQMRNTVTTDLNFKYDKQREQLLPIISGGRPQKITIEYTPIYERVEDIQTTYWQDILRKMSLAKTKIILGQIRSKYKASGNLWSINGDAILAEGREELNKLEDMLETNAQLTYPLD